MTRRVKISVSLPADLVERIDRQVARRPGGTRSGVMEEWLRRAARADAHQELDRAIEAYYRDLREDERADDRVEAEAWIRLGAATWSARERAEDEPATGRRAARRRGRR
jgi:Arc/MetJ-type ribon-helix-helix transcriptional regulator